MDRSRRERLCRRRRRYRYRYWCRCRRRQFTDRRSGGRTEAVVGAEVGSACRATRKASFELQTEWAVNSKTQHVSYDNLRRTTSTKVLVGLMLYDSMVLSFCKALPGRR
jgi:hypothetical protein